MGMTEIIQPFINMISPIVGEKAIAKIIELFLENNQLIIDGVTWNLKNNFFILKLELQTDRAPMTINDIFLEGPNKTIIFPSEFSFVELQESSGNYRELLIDPSSENKYLKSFEDYSGGSINLQFDCTKKLSIVFSNIHENIDFKDWKIVFKNNKKLRTYNLYEIFIEVPNIILYLKQRNIDIEKRVKELISILEL